MPAQRRIPVCLVLAVLVALAFAAPSLALAPGVRAWLTTGDRSSLLAEQPPEAFGAAGAHTAANIPRARPGRRAPWLGGA
jgi:hypothetical protein